MKNDVGSYKTRKIGTGRIDAYARLCLYDEVVQGNAVVQEEDRDQQDRCGCACTTRSCRATRSCQTRRGRSDAVVHWDEKEKREEKIRKIKRR